MNKWTGIGRVGSSELKYTGGGTAVLRIRLATTGSYVNRAGERQERTEWHTVIVWGKRAERLNPHVGKGKELGIEGRVQYRQWEDKSGGKRESTEIVASDIHLIGGGGGKRSGGSGQERSSYGGGGGDSYPADDFGDDPDDLPFSVCTADDTRRLTRERWEVAL